MHQLIFIVATVLYADGEVSLFLSELSRKAKQQRGIHQYFGTVRHIRQQQYIEKLQRIARGPGRSAVHTAGMGLSQRLKPIATSLHSNKNVATHSQSQ